MSSRRTVIILIRESPSPSATSGVSLTQQNKADFRSDNSTELREAMDYAEFCGVVCEWRETYCSFGISIQQRMYAIRPTPHTSTRIAHAILTMVGSRLKYFATPEQIPANLASDVERANFFPISFLLIDFCTVFFLRVNFSH